VAFSAGGDGGGNPHEPGVIDDGLVSLASCEQPRHPKDRLGHRCWPTASTKDRTPTHGYEPTREAAMAAFAKSWRRG
jgi:hypothetical protein